MPNYSGDSSGDSDPSGGGGYSGGGGNDNNSSGYGSNSYQSDWEGINANIGAALAGGYSDDSDDFSYDGLVNGVVGSAPNVGNTNAINYQSHVGPDPGSLDALGAALGFQGNEGSFDPEEGYNRGDGLNWKNAYKYGSAGLKAGSFFGPGVGGLAGGLAGLVGLFGLPNKQLVANPDGSVGLGYAAAPTDDGFGDGSTQADQATGGGGEGTLYGGAGGGSSVGIPVGGGSVSPTQGGFGGAPAVGPSGNNLRFGGDQSLQLYRERLEEDDDPILGSEYFNDELNKFTKSLF